MKLKSISDYALRLFVFAVTRANLLITFAEISLMKIAKTLSDPLK